MTPACRAVIPARASAAPPDNADGARFTSTLPNSLLRFKSLNVPIPARMVFCAQRRLTFPSIMPLIDPFTQKAIYIWIRMAWIRIMAEVAWISSA